MPASMVKNRFAFSYRIIVMSLYFKDITMSPTGAKVTLKATHWLPSEVKTFPSDIPGRAHCWLGPTLLPSLPQSPFWFCSSAVVALDLPPWWAHTG